MAPAACTRSASQSSEVTTRIAPGSVSAARSRTISSSAESRRGRGACVTSITRRGDRRTGRLLEHDRDVLAGQGNPALEQIDEADHRRVAVLPPGVRTRADHVHAVDHPPHADQRTSSRRQRAARSRGDRARDRIVLELGRACDSRASKRETSSRSTATAGASTRSSPGRRPAAWPCSPPIAASTTTARAAARWSATGPSGEDRERRTRP